VAFEKGVLAFVKGVLAFVKGVLAFENGVLAFEKGVNFPLITRRFSARVASTRLKRIPG
jgi:hypothetical protein